MPGVDASVICHHLNLHLSCKLVKQKKSNIEVEKQLAMKEEVKNLLEVDFIDKFNTRAS